KPYREANPALTFSYDGLENGDTAVDLTTEPTCSTSADETTGVGIYLISCAGGVADNYSFSYVSAQLTIKAKTLTVTADPQTKVYGQANPALTFSYDGFENGDTSDDLTTEPTCSTSADETIGVARCLVSGAGGVA